MNPKTILFLTLVLNVNCYADIVYPQPPERGREVARKSLEPIFLEGLRVEDVTLAEPFQCYGGVGATGLAAGQLLSAASPGSWRYLVMRGTNAVGAMQLFNDKKDGNTLKFSGFYETDFSNEMLEAMRRAKALPQVKKRDYEPRRLGIPGIYFDALWLHGKSDDIIIPFPYPFKRNLKAYQPYSEQEIIKVLKPEARELMKAPNLLR